MRRVDGISSQSLSQTSSRVMAASEEGGKGDGFVCGRHSRGPRLAAVAVLLSAACCATVALWMGDAPRGGPQNAMLEEEAATRELALANAEILGYSTQLQIGREPAATSGSGRQTQLWNAAENDEVHVTNGRLTVCPC